MSLTRKEFFQQSLFSLGRSVFDIAGGVTEIFDGEQTPLPPIEGDNLCAVADNSLCLAKNCGCFSCVERCEPQAIQVIPGTGIVIDTDRCTGCRACENICPTTPTAVRLMHRT